MGDNAACGRQCVEREWLMREREELYGILGAKKLKMAMIRIRGGIDGWVFEKSPDVLDDLYVADNSHSCLPRSITPRVF